MQLLLILRGILWKPFLFSVFPKRIPENYEATFLIIFFHVSPGPQAQHWTALKDIHSGFTLLLLTLQDILIFHVFLIVGLSTTS